MKELFTVEDVSKILKVNPEIVRRKVRTGQIKAYKVGKSWRFSADCLKNYLDKCLS